MVSVFNVFSVICALSLVSVSHAVSLNQALSMNQTITDLICTDGLHCPDFCSCCYMLTIRRFGCCPLKGAICCVGANTCCPQGTTCDGKGRCVREPIASVALQNPNEIEETYADTMKSEPAVKKTGSNDNDICPDGSDCGAGMHCCSTSAGFRCCPYGWACCGGGWLCCAIGSNDKTEKEMNAALRFVQEIMSVRKKEKL